MSNCRSSAGPGYLPGGKGPRPLVSAPSEASRGETALAEAFVALREAGQRERHRQLLERAIADAAGALAAARLRVDAGRRDELAPRCAHAGASLDAARATLARAHAAKAEDALHGASQLSLSAQRAPTLEACEEGWGRVAALVAGAVASARFASQMAAELAATSPGSVPARQAARVAASGENAARRAQRLLGERNHAYTFHADGAFSFGEGWYLAAAAVLAGVAVQIEPNRDGTAQAQRFLADAGLTANLQPYRSRPRAMKQTTAIVARAFELAAVESQQRLRSAFLGDAPTPSAVAAWIDERLRGSSTHAHAKKVLLWVRDGAHDAHRNTRHAELAELCRCVARAGLVGILVGDALPGEVTPEGVIDMILFWKAPIFRGADSRRAQLQFFEHLRTRHGLVGQLGVTTAGMDGPALMGLPTAYLTDAPNVRMQKWVGAVPGYEEVVRENGYLERVSRILARWGAA